MLDQELPPIISPPECQVMPGMETIILEVKRTKLIHHGGAFVTFIK